MKLLLRSKLVFSARAYFIDIFGKILHYKMTSKDAKEALEAKESYKLPL